jgi:CRP/FNR family transcriptional regulator
MNLTCSTCPVRDNAACSVLSLEERDALVAAGRTRTLKRGEMLFAAGDEDAACATLVSGALKVSSIDQDGNEQILALVHPAGFIGELFAPFAHHDVVALTESKLCTFARSDTERAIDEYPALARALLRRSQADLLATRHLLEGNGEPQDAGAAAALERWRIAYDQMARDAQAMGIPASAVPPLPAEADAEAVRQARDLLRGIIASFVSSGL